MNKLMDILLDKWTIYIHMPDIWLTRWDSRVLAENV